MLCLRAHPRLLRQTQSNRVISEHHTNNDDKSSRTQRVAPTCLLFNIACPFCFSTRVNFEAFPNGAHPLVVTQCPGLKIQITFPCLEAHPLVVASLPSTPGICLYPMDSNRNVTICSNASWQRIGHAITLYTRALTLRASPCVVVRGALRTCDITLS